MTKKDFEIIAKIVAMAQVATGEHAKNFIDYELYKTNERYSSQRFWERVDEIKDAIKLQGD